MMVGVGIAVAVLAALFAAAYLFARRIDNYGVVDVVWSYSFLFVALIYASAFAAWGGVALVLLVIVAAWSLRLGTHLFVRVYHAHPGEDSRYSDLRRDWGDGFGAKMFLFFQAQALSVVVLSLPFLLVLRDPPMTLGWLGVVGITLWGVALVGEFVADRQLARFKKRRRGGDRRAVCREGLWRYSRHPNYFFEWLIWVGFAVFALQSEYGFLAFASPMIIYYLVTRVSGIPPTEAAAVRSKGDAYRRYQQTTNAFFPWPPRTA